MSFGLTSQLPYCPLPHAYPVAAACHAEEKRRSGGPAPALGSPPNFPAKQTFQKTGPSRKPELPAQPPVHQRDRLAHKALSSARHSAQDAIHHSDQHAIHHATQYAIQYAIRAPVTCRPIDLPTNWPANQLCAQIAHPIRSARCHPIQSNSPLQHPLAYRPRDSAHRTGPYDQPSDKMLKNGKMPARASHTLAPALETSQNRPHRHRRLADVLPTSYRHRENPPLNPG